MSNTVQFPHTTNSTAAIQRFEPVVSSNFNAHFVLMGNLKTALGDYGYLSEYIRSVTGLFVEKAGGSIEGGYKYIKFRYDSNEKETVYDVNVSFHNFLDQNSKALVYNGVVAWSRYKYNPLTGTKTLKVDYANAAIVVEKFNRDGTLFWRRTGLNAFPMSEIEDMAADYGNHEAGEFACTFSCDYVQDITNDPRLAALN
jgi:hypothetical protein